MKAIKLEKPYEIEEVETAMPQPKAGEALIRVKSAGICGSDIGAYRGTNNLVTYPRIIGHEIAGEVLSIPENEKGINQQDISSMPSRLMPALPVTRPNLNCVISIVWNDRSVNYL